MSSQYIFTMHRLSKLHPPDKTVLDNVSLAFYPGAKIGVLGYNGAGKSTLLRIMAGVDQEYRGEAALAPGATVGVLEQEPGLDESKDVRGTVEEAVAETKALLDRFNELAANYSEETAEEFGQIQAKIEAADAWNLDTQLEYAMDALRLPPPDAEVSALSGGERRRVALCRLLLSAPDLLLLDEPTNHLDAESVDWLERHLADYKGAIVAVTHDRYFLDNVAGWILELDRGKGIPYEGNYSSWLEQKAKRTQQEASESEARKKASARELEWVRASPSSSIAARASLTRATTRPGWSRRPSGPNRRRANPRRARRRAPASSSGSAPRLRARSRQGHPLRGQLLVLAGAEGQADPTGGERIRGAQEGERPRARVGPRLAFELDRGKGIPYEGNYSSWLEQKAKRTQQEASESEARKKASARELEWVRASPSSSIAARASLTRATTRPGWSRRP